MKFCRVAATSDLWSGEMLGVVVRGRRVLLVNVEGKVCAYQDRCPHKGAPLSEGKLDGKVLTCSVHGWMYDAQTGCGINPERIELPRYPVNVEEGDILIDIGDEGNDGKHA